MRQASIPCLDLTIMTIVYPGRRVGPVREPSNQQDILGLTSIHSFDNVREEPGKRGHQFITARSLMFVCSKCRSEKIRRSHIRYYDVPLLFLFVPSRCLACHARFYMFRYGRAALLLRD